MKKDNNNNSHDDGDSMGESLHQQVQVIITTAILQVANDYYTLFTGAEDSAPVKSLPESVDESLPVDLCERHKQGKVILSHLEALLKINNNYIDKSEQGSIAGDDKKFKRFLIDSARHDLQDGSTAKEG